MKNHELDLVKKLKCSQCLGVLAYTHITRVFHKKKRDKAGFPTSSRFSQDEGLCLENGVTDDGGIARELRARPAARWTARERR